MKRSLLKGIFTIATVAILFVCLSFSCMAAEENQVDHLHQPKLTASHPVYVSVIYNIDGKPDYTKSEEYDPKKQVYTATTPSGLEVEVWYPEGGLTLVIHEIKEKEPLKWFDRVFPDCKKITPLEIFFLTPEGYRKNLPPGTKVTLSGLSEEQYMVFLSKKEVKDRLPYGVKDGKLTFYSTKGSDYYVLCIGGDLPATGDASHNEIWLLLMLLSIIGIIWVSIALKRQAALEGAAGESETLQKEWINENCEKSIGKEEPPSRRRCGKGRRERRCAACKPTPDFKKPPGSSSMPPTAVNFLPNRSPPWRRD